LVIPTIWDHQIASATDGGGGSPQVPVRERHRENFENRTSILLRERERGRESFGDIHCLAFVVE
jgi:hypothetical protein